ncbi:glycosyltransferase [Streptomyces rubellomurinus]|uniref:Glycosyl transferase n=1 Tax=Streptomyces rubellomurinus (strain ATCC 31215) TaxID=359131 RepID=A0A0F2TBG7_STRR3|nr:glycosyltransferase [Streptomyces rubellomurinus]KJS60499.1 glycosyl transferase [Streptomyces rubellomurinus]
MRVVLSTYGSRGDVQPLAALAVRLREAGVRATVCAPPDEEFARRLAAAGVEMVPVGESVRSLVTGPPPQPGDFPKRVAALVEQFHAAVGALAGPGDTVVGTGLFPAIAGAQAAAERVGARFVYAALQPNALPSPHHPPLEYPMHPFPPGVTDPRELWELNVGVMNALFAEPVNGFRTSVGLAAVDNVRDHVFTERPWLATDAVLGPWVQPAELAVVQTGAWLLADERPLPAELSAFLDAGQAPVYVGFGSMPLRGAPDAAEACARAGVAAARAHGRRVVLARGWAGLDRVDDRGDCLVVGEVNQQALFARCAAVVHHGGAGTTTAAAAAGAPQVVVPQIADQPYWARRVAELGIGAAHDGPAPSTDTLTAALARALDGAVRERAADVRGRIRTDGAAVAARLLIDGQG